MSVTVRPARTADVKHIKRLIEPLVSERILLGKDPVVFYESIQQFVVAEEADTIVGCGALHVMWRDLAEVRTLAVAETHRGLGVGHVILEELEKNARELGISRLFCLTFETTFFESHGFAAIGENEPDRADAVSKKVYAELVRSPDEGIAEFLDLARVKPNTLGNTRMLKIL
jgi:amino-acid N-acetyltransferase